MMDLSQLQKMADKTNILDDKLTNNDVADIFNKVKAKQSKYNNVKGKAE